MPQLTSELIRPDLPDYVVRLIQETEHEDLILARAYVIASQREDSRLRTEDVIYALAEFQESSSGSRSWAGFYYSLGGALLSVGVGGIFSILYLAVPGPLIPFTFLTLIGLLLILAGHLED